MPSFEIASHPLLLHRFPALKHDTLQAWDAADEYLLNTVLPELSRYRRILVINDAFGALTCTLAQAASSDVVIFHVTDSFISQQGCKANLLANHIEADITFLTSIQSLPADIDCVLFKLPRSLAFLEHQLSVLQHVVSAQTTLIAGAKAKDIHMSTLSLFEKYIGDTKTSLAKKKARLIFSSRTHGTLLPTPTDVRWTLDHTSFEIKNLANVFSRQSLDIGGRFLIEHLPTDKRYAHIIDLGTGNGVVGLVAGTLHPQANITCVDESFMAVESARLNLTQHISNAVTCIADDCLSTAEHNSADLILCNPPFHQQNTISDHIAWQMFNDAQRVLAPAGELRIVGNRHLDYHVKLKKIFGNVEQVAANKKFVILKSFKR